MGAALQGASIAQEVLVAVQLNHHVLHRLSICAFYSEEVVVLAEVRDVDVAIDVVNLILLDTGNPQLQDRKPHRPLSGGGANPDFLCEHCLVLLEFGDVGLNQLAELAVYRSEVCQAVVQYEIASLEEFGSLGFFPSLPEPHLEQLHEVPDMPVDDFLREQDAEGPDGSGNVPLLKFRRVIDVFDMSEQGQAVFNEPLVYSMQRLIDGS